MNEKGIEEICNIQEDRVVFFFVIGILIGIVSTHVESILTYGTLYFVDIVMMSFVISLLILIYLIFKIVKEL